MLSSLKAQLSFVSGFCLFVLKRKALQKDSQNYYWISYTHFLKLALYRNGT